MLTPALYRRRLRNAEMLRSWGFGSFAQARWTNRSERWDPVAVICGPGVPQIDVTELIELASDPRLGIAVVAMGGSAASPHVLQLSGPDGVPPLDALGSVLSPQHIDADDLGEIAVALTDTAANRQSVFWFRRSRM